MQLERLPQVLQRTSLSRAHLYALMQRAEFPKPRKVGKRAVAWRSDEVDQWIESCPEGGSWLDQK
ncbi:AlpA family phage regulatory protein [Roseovarius sp.]|uniref:helix-turn-helix transcriptional regulator n=1 Tax=Roseovarius sp. TaxID=1486281 RepID=UPI00261B1147|nr:AlpA family phage regulatory protein [Roseovarius sp.]